MSTVKKIIFLYSELSGYFMACIKEWCARGFEAHIVRWPVNREAPFDFKFPEGAHCYEKEAYSRAKLIRLLESIHPDAIYSAGWMDKDYVAICRRFKRDIPTILGMDNKWRGDIRQKVACMMAPFTIRRAFTYVWVPGEQQALFASRLGFDKDHILRGVYTCDVPFFNALFAKSFPEKQKSFPHRLIYAGRYQEFKGLQELWTAFALAKKELKSDWELHCLGTGILPPANNPGIHHHGFVQPADMAQHIVNGGIFVMPSRVEPWGVVLHEFAAAGFPLVCSDQVGAAEVFLQQGVNGIMIPAGNVAALTEGLYNMMTTPDGDLLKMAQESHRLAQRLTPEIWANTLRQMIG